MKQYSTQPEGEPVSLSSEKGRELAEDEIDAEIALAALAEIESDPSQIVGGEELKVGLRPRST